MWMCVSVIIIILIIIDFGSVSFLSLTLCISPAHSSLMELVHLSLIQLIHHFLTHQLCISSFSLLTPSLSLANSSPISEGFSFHPFLPFHPSASHFCLSSLFLTSFSAPVISAGRPAIEKTFFLDEPVMCVVTAPSMMVHFIQQSHYRGPITEKNVEKWSCN